jgi:hypothetical protein
MNVGVYGQPADSAPKWAAEGNTFAYLHEPESGRNVAPDAWAAKFVAAGITKFVLQDRVVSQAANAIPRGGIIGVVPGAPDPTRGGAPVFDEPERTGVTAAAFRDYARSLALPGSAVAGLDRWMNFQGDKITGGPPNLGPIPGFPPTDTNRVPYDVWTQAVEWAGIDWHVAARGTYPVGLLVKSLDRMGVWGPGRKLYAVLERGPQTASDNPRYLSPAEILCQTGIAVAMNAWAIVGFYTREAHPTRGGFSFDPRDPDQVQASIRANATALRFDDPTGTPAFVGVEMVKDRNTARWERDLDRGFVVRTSRTIDGGRPCVVEVNVSHSRAIASDLDGASIPPLGVRFTYSLAPDAPPVSSADLPPVAAPPPPPPPTDPATTNVTRAELAERLNEIRASIRDLTAGVSANTAAAKLANDRLDAIAQASGRPVARPENPPQA